MPTLQLNREKSGIIQLKMYKDITNFSLAMLSVKLITYTMVVEAVFFFWGGGSFGSVSKTTRQRMGDRFFPLVTISQPGWLCGTVTYPNGQ